MTAFFMRNTFIIISLFSLLGLLGSTAFGQPKPKEALFLQLMNLELELKAINLQVVNTQDRMELQALADFLGVMLVQTESGQQTYLKESKKWLKEFAKLTGKSTLDSSYGLFKVALYRAIVASQFSDYTRAARAMLSVYRHFQDMHSIHPAHPNTQLAGACLKVIAEQLPDNYLRYSDLVGIELPEGNGFNLIDRSFQRAKVRSVEQTVTTGLLRVFLLWEFHPEREAGWLAWRELNPVAPQLSLIRYAGLTMALKSGKVKEAMEIANDMENSGQFKLIPMARYQKAKALLYQLDPSAKREIDRFLYHYSGENYVKTSCLYMAWSNVLGNQPVEADVWLNKVIHEGSSVNWADQQALRDARSETSRNKELVSLRLLFDGGYYTQCLHRADSVLSTTPSISDRAMVEILYRKGNSYLQLDNIQKAMTLFERIVNEYSSVESYQVPKSALEAAKLNYQTGKRFEAFSLLDTCLELNRYGHQSTYKRMVHALRREWNSAR